MHTTSQESVERLTTQEVAETLGYSVRLVRMMLREGLMNGEREGGKWLINPAELTSIQGCFDTKDIPKSHASPSQTSSLSATEISDFEHAPRQSGSSSPENEEAVDSGMVQVSLALAGIGIAIAAFLPGVREIPTFIRSWVALLVGILAFCSAYGAWWLLAWYRLEERSRFGFREMGKLLMNINQGPYWLLALGLLCELILAVLLTYIALLA